MSFNTQIRQFKVTGMNLHGEHEGDVGFSLEDEEEDSSLYMAWSCPVDDAPRVGDVVEVSIKPIRKQNE